MTAAQDPNELFDVVTWRGDPTGVRKRRRDVHRDGDWHPAIHIWVIGRRDGVGFLLVQRRSQGKDTQPGALDVTVGGHLGAGETWREGLREAEEEIGLSLSEQDVVFAGIRRGILETDSGIRDHEIQRVFFVRNDAPLTDYRPNPAELAGLIEISLDDILELASGTRDSATVDVLDASTLTVESGQIKRPELARSADRYFYRVAIAARLFLAGEKHFSV